MSLLSHLLSAGAGYAAAGLSESNAVKNFCDNNFRNEMSLEETIREYARTKRGISVKNNMFAYELHKIAKQYEECDFYHTYGKLL